MQHDQESITAYLLGNAADADTERFDELSIADSEFADALNAVENDLVDAYVNGELYGAVLQQFKTFYLASPQRRQRVQFAEAFHEYSATRPIDQRSAVQTEQKDSSGGFSTWLSPSSVLQWGFAAAAILLVFVAGWLALQNSALRRQVDETVALRNAAVQREQELQKQLDGDNANLAETERELSRITDEQRRLEQELEKERQRARNQIIAEQNQRSERPAGSSPAVSIAAIVLTPQLRSSSNLPSLSIPVGSSRVELQIELESFEYESFRVELRDQSAGSTVWRSDRIRSAKESPGNSITISVPARLFKPQIYTATVTGTTAQGAAEIIGDYAFRVVR